MLIKKIVNKMDLIGRFEKILNENNNKSYKDNVIGVLSEKTLHKTIKNLYEDNQAYQEIKIDGYYVDILKDNNIIEVQTKQFDKFRNKLIYLLDNYDYSINVIYPVFNHKVIYYIDEHNNVSLPKNSPKKLKYPEVFYELYKIKSLLTNDKLKITLLVLDINEYRMKSNNRKKYVLLDRIPIKLVEEVKLFNKEDYLNLLPNNLKEIFTVKDICELTKCDNKYVSKMVNVLKYIGVIEMIGKEGKRYLYRIKKG